MNLRWPSGNIPYVISASFGMYRIVYIMHAIGESRLNDDDWCSAKLSATCKGAAVSVVVGDESVDDHREME